VAQMLFAAVLPLLQPRPSVNRPNRVTTMTVACAISQRVLPVNGISFWRAPDANRHSAAHATNPN
jgi:hypothetical protein